jgi:uncharacterized protein (TIGR03083 family)
VPTATTSTTADPRRPSLERSVAMRLAAHEYDRVADQLASLAPHEWTLPSGCPPWDVRALATHVLGMAEMASGLREQLRQQRAAGRAGGVFVDALTALQVEERQHLAPEQVVERLRAVAPRAARFRRRMPGLLRRRVLPGAQPTGGRPDSPTERWAVGFLVDVVLTRDPWMHRSDIALATGRPMHLTADHDGVLVDDVVHEWATRHGAAVSLTLTGPAGGHWSFGSGGPEVELDAVDFCRVLSGRGEASGLLATEVPF